MRAKTAKPEPLPDQVSWTARPWAIMDRLRTASRLPAGRR
jgi:hypothetical protein